MSVSPSLSVCVCVCVFLCVCLSICVWLSVSVWICLSQLYEHVSQTEDRGCYWVANEILVIQKYSQVNTCAHTSHMDTSVITLRLLIFSNRNWVLLTGRWPLGQVWIPVNRTREMRGDSQVITFRPDIISKRIEGTDIFLRKLFLKNVFLSYMAICECYNSDIKVSFKLERKRKVPNKLMLILFNSVQV